MVNSLEDRLLNWGNWSRRRACGPQHCASIEHRYRSPQCWYSPEPRILIDELDAWQLEQAIVRLPMQAQRSVIVRRYCLQQPREIICRVLGIRFDRFEDYLETIKTNIANHLQTLVNSSLMRETAAAFTDFSEKIETRVLRGPFAF